MIDASDPQNIEPESRPGIGTSAISATGKMGLAFTVAILLIFLTGIHPARWFLAVTITLGLATTLILRFSRRS